MTHRKGWFVLSKTSDGKFHFVLKAENGEVIAQSETYNTKSGALNGIDSVRRNAPDAVLDDRT